MSQPLLPTHSQQRYSIKATKRRSGRNRLAIRFIIIVALAFICTYATYASIMLRRAPVPLSTLDKENLDNVVPKIKEGSSTRRTPGIYRDARQTKQQAEPNDSIALPSQQASTDDERTQDKEADLSGYNMPTLAPRDPSSHSDNSSPVEYKTPEVVQPQLTPTMDPPRQTNTDDRGEGESQHPTQAYEGLYSLRAMDIDGQEQPLSMYAGNVTLVVNVASACGYTDSNYKGLQQTYDKYHKSGFTILAFPCNQFGAQERGSLADIKAFCTSRYHVTFPMFDKVEVNGPVSHPVFKYLKGALPPSEGAGQDIGWNFYKFLVDKSGHPVKRFSQEFDVAAVESAVYQLLTA